VFYFIRLSPALGFRQRRDSRIWHEHLYSAHATILTSHPLASIVLQRGTTVRLWAIFRISVTGPRRCFSTKIISLTIP
jgi:hypothetical protein